MRPQVACLLLLFTYALAAKDSSEDFDIENLRKSEWTSLDDDQNTEPTNDNQQALREALESYLQNRKKNSQESNIPSNSFSLTPPQSFAAQDTPFTFDTSNLQPQLSQGNFNFGQKNNKPSLELLVNKPQLSHSNVAQLLNSPQLNQNNPNFTPLSSRQQQGINIPVASGFQFSQGSVSQNLNRQQFNPNTQSFVPLTTAQQINQQSFAPFDGQPNVKQGSRVQFLDSPQSGQNQFFGQQSQFAQNVPNTASLLSGNYGTHLNQDVAPPNTNKPVEPPKKDEHVIDVKDFINYLQNGADDGSSADNNPPSNTPPNPPPPSGPSGPPGPDPKPSPPPYPQDLHNPESFLLKDTAEYMIARDNKGKPILLSDVEANGNLPTDMDYNQFSPAASTQVTVNALANGKFENFTREKQDSQYFDLLNIHSNGKFEKVNEIRPGSTFTPDFTSKQIYTANPSNVPFSSNKQIDNTQIPFSPSSQKTIQQFYDTRHEALALKPEEKSHPKSDDSRPVNADNLKLSTNTGHFLGNGPSTIPVLHSGQQGPFFFDQSKLVQVNAPEIYNKKLENVITVANNDYSPFNKPTTAYDLTQGNTPQDFYVDFTVTQTQNEQKTSIQNPQVFTLGNKNLNPSTPASFQLQNTGNEFNYLLPEFETKSLENVRQTPTFVQNNPSNTIDLERLQQIFKQAKEKQNYKSVQSSGSTFEKPGTKVDDDIRQDFEEKQYFTTQTKPNNNEDYSQHQFKSTKAISTQVLASNNTKREQTFYEKLRQAMTKTETTTTNLGSFGTTIPFDYTSNTAPSTFPTRTSITDTTFTNTPPTEYFTSLSNFPVTDFVTTNYPSSLHLTTKPYNDKFTTSSQHTTDKLSQTTDVFTTPISTTSEKLTTQTRPSTDKFTTGSSFPHTFPSTTSTNTGTFPPTTLSTILPSTAHLTTVNPSLSETQKVTPTPLIHTTISQSFTGDGEQGLPSYHIPSLPLQISGQQNVVSYYPSSNKKPLQDSISNNPNKKAPAYTNTWLKDNYLSDPIPSLQHNHNYNNKLKESEPVKTPLSEHTSQLHITNNDAQNLPQTNNFLSLISNSQSSSYVPNNNKYHTQISNAHILSENQFLNSQNNKYSYLQNYLPLESNQNEKYFLNYNKHKKQDSNLQTSSTLYNYNANLPNLHYRPISDYNKEITRGPYRPSKLDDNFKNFTNNEKNKATQSENNIANKELYGYVNVPNFNFTNMPQYLSNLNINSANKQNNYNLNYNYFNNKTNELSDSTSQIPTTQKEHNINASQKNPISHAPSGSNYNQNILYTNLNNVNGQSNLQLDTLNLNTNNKLNYFNIPNIPLTESSNLNTKYTQHEISRPLQDSASYNKNNNYFSSPSQLPFNYNNYNAHQNFPITEHISDFSSSSNNFYPNHKYFETPNKQENTPNLNIQYTPVSDYGKFNAQTSLSIQEQRPHYVANNNGNFVLISSQNNYHPSQSSSKPVYLSSTNGFYPNAPTHALLPSPNPAHNQNLPLHTQNNSPLATGQQPVALNDTPGLNVPHGYEPGQFFYVQNIAPEQNIAQGQNNAPGQNIPSGQNNIPQNGYNINIPAQNQPLKENDTPIIPGFNAVEAFEKEDLIPVYLPADNCSAVFEVLEDRQSVLGVRALPGNADCRITFTSPNSSRLAMQVLGLDLPQGENACSAASISVFSQREGRNMLLNQLCGEVKESPVMLTEGQSALVTVQSEAGTPRPGFTIVAFLW